MQGKNVYRKLGVQRKKLFHSVILIIQEPFMKNHGFSNSSCQWVLCESDYIMWITRGFVFNWEDSCSWPNCHLIVKFDTIVSDVIKWFAEEPHSVHPNTVNPQRKHDCKKATRERERERGNLRVESDYNFWSKTNSNPGVRLVLLLYISTKEQKQLSNNLYKTENHCKRTACEQAVIKFTGIAGLDKALYRFCELHANITTVKYAQLQC